MRRVSMSCRIFPLQFFRIFPFNTFLPIASVHAKIVVGMFETSGSPNCILDGREAPH